MTSNFGSLGNWNQRLREVSDPIKLGFLSFDPVTKIITVGNGVSAEEVYNPSGIPPGTHDTTHENGGSDEVSVTGLSGLLADPQTPVAHKTTHENGGSDEVSVTGLSGLLADGQTPLGHHVSHEAGGTDVVTIGYPTFSGVNALVTTSNIPAAAYTPLWTLGDYDVGGYLAANLIKAPVTGYYHVLWRFVVGLASTVTPFDAQVELLVDGVATPVAAYFSQTKYSGAAVTQTQTLTMINGANIVHALATKVITCRLTLYNATGVVIGSGVGGNVDANITVMRVG